MKLEVFPNVRNQTSGLIMIGTMFRLNKILYEALDKPKFIRIALDRNEKILGIMKCESFDLNKYSVMNSNKTFTATNLYSTIINIIQENPKKITFIFSGETEDGYLISHLDQGVINGE